MTRRASRWIRLGLGCVAAAAVLWMTAGCNTLEGIGKDLEAVGRAIREQAER